MRKLPLIGGDALDVYLTDHHAGATFGVELARRARGENKGTTYGKFLGRLATELEDDRAELESIMRALGRRPEPVKVSAAWAVEKLGRLKPNGRLLGYAPVSRLLELEGLIGGVAAKLALWRALGDLATDEPRLDRGQLDRLAERAETQLQDLRTHQQRAARSALATS